MPAKRKDTKSAWIDPDDAPEWTAEMFERAAIWHGDELIRPAQGTLTRRGRPKLANPKKQVTLRLDHDVLERLRASGSGWQSRVNEILRKAVGG